MRRIIIPSLMVAALALICADGAAAQKKPKDEVMHAAMMQQFAEVKAALTQLNERVTVLEGELAKVKQQQAEVMNEQRASQTVIKTVDATLSQLRLTNEGSALSLRTDIAQIRTDLGNLTQAVQRVLASASAAAQPSSAPVPQIEGYITDVKESEVTISLGSEVGAKQGMTLAVFSAETKRQIGTIQIDVVLDGKNSRARIVHKNPEVAAFSFSDIVRPL